MKIIPVEISLYHLCFKLAFNVPYKFKELAPARDMIDMAYVPYKRIYIRMFNVLSGEASQEQLVSISREHN